MRVCLLGASFDTGNRGVSALASSVIDGIMASEPSAEIFLLDYGKGTDLQLRKVRVGDRLMEMKQIWLRFSKKFTLADNVARLCLVVGMRRLLPHWIRKREDRSSSKLILLSEMDLAVAISGGDSFSDIYGFRQMLYVVLPMFLMVGLKRRLILLPQTYGPYRSFIARRIASYLLTKADLIFARDISSQRVAQCLVSDEKQIRLSPDVAFRLPVVSPSKVELCPVGAGAPKKIGINVNGLMFNGGYNRKNMFGLALDYPKFLNCIICELLQHDSVEVWLVPHTFAPSGHPESDPEAARKVRDSLPELVKARVRIVTHEYDQNEVKGVIGMCDFFIGSRMHSCIAALSQAIPCVGIAYSMKFAGVFESVGMEDWVIDGRIVSAERAVERVIELFGARDVVREVLGARAMQARTRLGTVFEEIVARGESQHTEAHDA